MLTVSAIYTHFGSKERTLTGLRRLAAQLRQPDAIIIINNNTKDDGMVSEARALVAELFDRDLLHILQMESNLGNAGGCARGLNFAFGELKSDFVWVLDDDSWPRPETLQTLLSTPVEANCIRMSLVVDPERADELSWPLSARFPMSDEDDWLHIRRKDALPAGKNIISRGGWLGALYPRHAWEKVGSPTEALFIRGEDEEYPWMLRNAGFSFITVRDSLLDHPSSPETLMHYDFGGRSFFYEPKLHPSRSYYKVRNWAWLQRLRYPKRYLYRFGLCMFYAALSIWSMLRRFELSPMRVYQLFRALHNGFYGKLRPY